MARPAGQYKKIIAEAVNIFQYQWLNEHIVFLHAYAEAFCAAAYAAGDVAGGYGYMAAWQDERLHDRELLIHLVDAFFQEGDIRFVEVRYFQFGFLVGVAGQCGAYGKEAVLYFAEQVFGILVGDVIVYQADVGVELIHGAVGIDTDIALGYFGAANEGCFAFIACFSIYFERHGCWC